MWVDSQLKESFGPEPNIFTTPTLLQTRFFPTPSGDLISTVGQFELADLFSCLSAANNNVALVRAANAQAINYSWCTFHHEGFLAAIHFLAMLFHCHLETFEVMR